MKIMFGNTNFGFVAGILAASVNMDQAVAYAASQRYVLVDVSEAPEGVKNATDKGNGKFGLSRVTEEAYTFLDLAFADAGVDVTENVAVETSGPVSDDIEVSSEESKAMTVSVEEIPTVTNQQPVKARGKNRGEYDTDFRRGDILNVIQHGQGPYQKPKEGPFLCLGTVYTHVAFVKLVDGVPTGDQFVSSKLKLIEGQSIIGRMTENWSPAA